MYCSRPTPAQIPAALVLRDWMQTDLVEAPGVSEISVKNIERGATHPRVRRPACFASIPATSGSEARACGLSQAQLKRGARAANYMLASQNTVTALSCGEITEEVRGLPLLSMIFSTPAPGDDKLRLTLGVPAIQLPNTTGEKSGTAPDACSTVHCAAPPTVISGPGAGTPMLTACPVVVFNIETKPTFGCGAQTRTDTTWPG